MSLSPSQHQQTTGRRRLRISVCGAVQGVGFRPFVYRLAQELQLAGWVQNTGGGVLIEAEGPRPELEAFAGRLQQDAPPLAAIHSLEQTELDAAGYAGFEIHDSADSADKTALVLPDVATCGDCLGEIFNSTDRRYLYPFTNCTNCGPRFSIIERLPYDRPHTSMKHFELCALCQAEYDDPADRRFHAQPNACPNCGPHLETWQADGVVLARAREAVRQTCEALRQGQIVAVKGLGGFHLLVDGRNEDAVQRLRGNKHREEKPLALMFPSLEQLRQVCCLSALEQRWLCSPAAPIVLLRRLTTDNSLIAAAVAPQNPYHGAMLPYTPLHHILLRALDFPVVATSGNLSDEPICTHEHEALERLGSIADLFLVHNRPIVRHVDDSVMQVVVERPMILRRARGYAPLPVRLRAAGAPTLAVGAHLKNTVAITSGCNVFISQHIGDLDTAAAEEAFHRAARSLQDLYETAPQIVACDMHPDYLSTRWARQAGLKTVAVQHHFAHVLACMAESDLDGPVLGVSWDGTGYGTDGHIWGGEFLVCTADGFERAARLRHFRLPGGEQAIKEPRRTAIGLLHEIYGSQLRRLQDLAPVRAFTEPELDIVLHALERQLNAPLTSSMGRLFDGLAALLDIRQRIAFEGQAAMQLEFAIQDAKTDERYAFHVAPGSEPTESGPTKSGPTKSGPTNSGPTNSGPTNSGPTQWVVDWEPIVRGVIEDLRAEKPLQVIAATFHNTLVEMIIDIARRAGHPKVVLTGGCFQNRYLLERAVQCLRQEQFEPYWHQRVPPNDGGIALGQSFAVQSRNEG